MLKCTVFLLLVLSLTWAYPTTKKDLSETELIQWLDRYGYLLSSDRLSESVSLMQRYAGIKATGTLDKKTKSYLKRSRCHLTDMNSEARQYYSKHLKEQMEVGKTSAGTYGRWNHSIITWSVAYYQQNRDPYLVSFERATTLIRHAFNLWQRAIPNLRFIELEEPRSPTDIEIWMKLHDPQLTNNRDLGYTIFPSTNTRADGDIHLNVNVSWWMGFDFPYGARNDFLSTVLHEIGHSLGLKHSPNSLEIMYPYNLHVFRHIPIQDAVRANRLYSRALPPVMRTNRITVLKRKRCFRQRFGDRMMRPKEDGILCTPEEVVGQQN